MCKKHPKYKAIRQPTSKCAECWQIWQTKQLTKPTRKIKQPGLSRRQANQIYGPGGRNDG
jgi:hypothetical protein